MTAKKSPEVKPWVRRVAEAAGMAPESAACATAPCFGGVPATNGPQSALCKAGGHPL